MNNKKSRPVTAGRLFAQDASALHNKKRGMFIEQIYYNISFFKCQINTERVCYIWA